MVQLCVREKTKEAAQYIWADPTQSVFGLGFSGKERREAKREKLGKESNTYAYNKVGSKHRVWTRQSLMSLNDAVWETNKKLLLL